MSGETIDRMHLKNLQILPAAFYLSIYNIYDQLDIKGLNVRRYLSYISTRTFSKAFPSRHFLAQS